MKDIRQMDSVEFVYVGSLAEHGRRENTPVASVSNCSAPLVKSILCRRHQCFGLWHSWRELNLVGDVVKLPRCR